MRVMVTGGAGRIGRVIVKRLLQHDWTVRVIDKVDEIDIVDVEYAACDVTDFESLRTQMRGCELVVHMAALPSPTLGPGSEVFRINVAGTFNVFEAAAAEGISRVVQASSINAIGCAWNLGDFDPPYLPVDEDFPRSTTDPYSLSKQMIEDIGDYYWRRDGITSVALRFPGVYSLEKRQSDRYAAFRQAMIDAIDGLIALDEAEQQQKLAQVRQETLDFRGTRPLEWNPERADPPFTAPSDDPLWRAYTFDRYNLWTYIEERDAALSVELALNADIEGSRALFVNADHNWLNYDLLTLARLFFPEAKLNKEALAGAASLVSLERARSLIAFEPEY